MRAWQGIRQSLVVATPAAMEEPVRLSSPRAALVPSSYVRCRGRSDPPMAVDAGAVHARARGWDYHGVASGHEAMITAPLEWAALLVQIAARSSGHPKQVAMAC
jgi:hypothetical protein